MREGGGGGLMDGEVLLPLIYFCFCVVGLSLLLSLPLLQEIQFLCKINENGIMLYLLEEMAGV